MYFNSKVIIRVILIIFISFYSNFTNAQILKPVKWSYAFKKINSGEGILYLKATIADGWHIYSQTGESGGPSKTKFVFKASKDFLLSGKTVEPQPIVEYENTFQMDVRYFEKSVVFQQRIKLKKQSPFIVNGTMEFMVCNNEKCLPPEEIDFSIPVK